MPLMIINTPHSTTHPCSLLYNKRHRIPEGYYTVVFFGCDKQGSVAYYYDLILPLVYDGPGFWVDLPKLSLHKQP